jgi:hypothetical protein
MVNVDRQFERFRLERPRQEDPLERPVDPWGEYIGTILYGADGSREIVYADKETSND